LDEAIQSIIDGYRLILPEVVLVAAACVLFTGAAFVNRRTLWAGVALVGVLAAGGVWWFVLPVEIASPSASLFRHDYLTWFAKGLGLAGGLVLLLLSWNQVSDQRAGEYHACLLLVTAGVNLVATANDLIVLFLALELISIPTYILLYLPRQDAAAQEAATKYFLLSVFSSALTLYGFSFLYGTTGSTNLDAIRAGLSGAGPTPGVLVIALVMIVAGLGFRITAVPFHFYAPDVYQGAPTAGAALLSFVPKLAGFVALFRVITTTLLTTPTNGPAQETAFLNQAQLLFWILAAVTMSLGNLLALLQDNLKRILAYSGVAHAGYMLVGLGVGQAVDSPINGIEALFFYLVIYGAMTVGAFAVLIYLSTPERSVETVDDLAGLGRSHPLTALLMMLFLFSLTGLPPTAGFWAKLNLFFAAWSAETPLFRLFGSDVPVFRILAVVMALNAAVAGWYYLRIVASMYLRQPIKPLPHPRELPGLASLVICGFATVALFVVPGVLWQAVEKEPLAKGKVGQVVQKP